MISFYHLAGVISSFFFLLSLYGIWDQLRALWLRRKDATLRHTHQVTAVLSLNQFTTSFSAFYSFLIYGLTVELFNPYLVWPRFIATGLVITILFEMSRDRRDLKSLSCFVLCCVALVIALAALFLQVRFDNHARIGSTVLLLFSSLLLLQGLLHQVYLIRKSKNTGALSIRLHQLLFLKDVSNLLLGVSMGLAAGWPIIISCIFFIVVRAILLWQFKIYPCSRALECSV